MRLIGIVLTFMAGFLVARYIYVPETSAEKAGKAVDRIVEKAIDVERPPAQKGLLEKAGEKLDEAVEEIRETESDASPTDVPG